MNEKESVSKKNKKTDKENVAVEPTEITPSLEKVKTLYCVKFFYEWCKSCGICSALCPKSVILHDETGRPYIDTMDNCIGCRFCEIHCPDFAITVKERNPARRKTDGSR